MPSDDMRNVANRLDIARAELDEAAHKVTGLLHERAAIASKEAGHHLGQLGKFAARHLGYRGRICEVTRIPPSTFDDGYRLMVSPLDAPDTEIEVNPIHWKPLHDSEQPAGVPKTGKSWVNPSLQGTSIGGFWVDEISGWKE